MLRTIIFLVFGLVDSKVDEDMDTSCTKNQHTRVSDQTFLASEL